LFFSLLFAPSTFLLLSSLFIWVIIKS
jgi:hypothetical protein